MASMSNLFQQVETITAGLVKIAKLINSGTVSKSAIEVLTQTFNESAVEAYNTLSQIKARYMDERLENTVISGACNVFTFSGNSAETYIRQLQFVAGTLLNPNLYQDGEKLAGAMVAIFQAQDVLYEFVTPVDA